jgi:hypothetical protein
MKPLQISLIMNPFVIALDVPPLRSIALEEPQRLSSPFDPYLTGEYLDLARKAGPYLINTKGIGTMMSATQPNRRRPEEMTISYHFFPRYTGREDETYPTRY